MSIIEEIEEFQKLLKDKLYEELDLRTSEKFEAFIKSFAASDIFQPYRPASWHGDFYLEFKNSLNRVDPIDLNIDMYNAIKALNNLHQK